MPVDKDKLYQSLFKTLKKSHTGWSAGEVQSLCVEEWKKIKQKCRGKNDDFETEVKGVMAREQAKMRSRTIMNFFSKVRINVSF